MNNDSFLKEVLESEHCPEGFSELYSEFSHFQQLALETLIEFSNICKKHNIIYHLAFGSLLGAFRDSGQIPWDYDVDVMIHFEDRYRLIKALDDDLADKYYYTCGELHDCEQFFIRIAPKGFSTDVLHVDVFYYIGLPDDQKEFTEHTAEIRKLILARSYKIEPLKGTLKHKIKLMIYKARYFLWSKNRINEKIIENAGKYNSFSSSKIGNCNSICGLWYFPINCIKNTSIIQFNIFSTKSYVVEFLVPSDSSELLCILYGDFRKIPPLKSRIDEVVKRYDEIIGSK